MQPLAFLYSRFSSDIQAQGSSLARQSSAAQTYCDVHGLRLSDTSFHDHGVSAFKGRNVSHGALGNLLELIQQGVIPAGSYVLVESTDRLSRQDPWSSLPIVQQIVNSGVIMVTLADGESYSSETLAGPEGLFKLMRMLLSMERAAQESQMKSARMKAAWRKNREDAKQGKRIRTKRGPDWLKLVDGEWQVLEDKAMTVREIHRRYAEGESSNAIGKSLGVSGASIIQLIRRQAAFGVQQIGEIHDGKRVVVDRIVDGFPRIVDEDTQRLIEKRLAGKAGKRIEHAAASVLGKARGTRGILTGVLFDDGQRCKVKRYKSTDAYVQRQTNRYVKSVRVLDDIMVRGWDQIVAAHEAVSADDASLFEALEAAEYALLDAQEAWANNPTPGTMQRLRAFEMLRDEAREALEEFRNDNPSLQLELPETLEGLSKSEANRWVRYVVARVDTDNDFRVALKVTLKNGQDLNIA